MSSIVLIWKGTSSFIDPLFSSMCCTWCFIYWMSTSTRCQSISESMMADPAKQRHFKLCLQSTRSWKTCIIILPWKSLMPIHSSGVGPILPVWFVLFFICIDLGICFALSCPIDWLSPLVIWIFVCLCFFLLVCSEMRY